MNLKKEYLTNCVFALALASSMYLLACASSGAFKDGPAFSPIDAPSEKAVIYLYKALGYGRGEFPIVINGNVVTKIKKGGYYVYISEPGALELTLIEYKRNMADLAKYELLYGGITAATMALIPDISHSINIEVKPNKIYYIREKKGAGVGLEVVDDHNLAVDEISKCRKLPAYKPPKKKQENSEN
jgi:hypothetical protein